MSSVLAVGIYMADRPNVAGHIVHELACSRRHAVTQRWTALALGGEGSSDLPCTVAIAVDPAPKFALIGEMTPDALAFDWLLVIDDDVELPTGFLDRFLDIAAHCDFALCQPARTADSFIDHGIVLCMPGIMARRTRFVEIGPVVAIRRDAMRYLLPLDAACGMGWGLDFIWPCIMEDAGLRIGIVDAAPVAHRMRKPVAAYDHGDAAREMFQRMAGHRHLSRDAAFTIVEVHA